MTPTNHADLQRLEALKQSSIAALDTYLRVMFPVGTRVVVDWNPGTMVGHVEFEPRDGQLGIRCESGKRRIHWKSWSEIRHAG